ncbi:MAG TPA: primosomal protein N' [Candidatus Saccharimonadales bacterium]|nr:primosomal protein N' [Candidatus Saccharimonadales bacterium]
MPYLKILVGEASFHGKEALTYESAQSLSVGTIVTVPLRNQKVLGVVLGNDTKPSFQVKKIIDTPALKPLPKELIALHEWMTFFYPAPLGTITQHFLPSSLPKIILETNDGQTGPPTQTLPPLTNDQQQALKSTKGPGLHLLHGETGTGKTRVYIEIAKRQLAQGRSSIILTPEISLTSQLAQEFEKVLGRAVVKVVHSQLSPKMRQTMWVKILQSSKPLIIIGPRSALFSPLKNIGLIVVDEAHETAYKQDKAPYYHASAVGAQLAKLHQATLVIGSATPLVSDYYIAQAKDRPIVEMKQIAADASSAPPLVTVVDRRDRQAFNRSRQLSDTLLTGVQQTLDRGEQALLFLNRRGTARVVLCEACGWQAVCPHCDLPLTYHGDTHKLVCHSCNYRATNVTDCPECSNPTILFKSVGTKAIVDETQRLFPSAKIQRFDTDNTKLERLEVQYGSIRSGDIDILVGTQTLAKGLDLPNLGFVGIINAETGISFPDFSAAERTYQLLSQVLGRIGRGHRATQAVIQSYSPDSLLVKTAIAKNWSQFYNNELTERCRFNFPPFCYLLKLSCRRATATAAEKSATELKASLLLRYNNVVVDGPAASFHEKIRNQFQWQLVVKSRSRSQLLNIIKDLKSGWSYDIDPIDLL